MSTRLNTFAFLLTLSIFSLGSSSLSSDEGAGKAIYNKSCASCHGQNGEGVKGKYKRPLVGEMSIPKLSRYIEKYMPEEKPELIQGDDAVKVAKYVYYEFYSPIAQTRNRPATIDLARLTGVQYQNSVSDLVHHFRWIPPRAKDSGLVGEYFNDRTPGRKSRIKRIDSKVRFRVNKDQPAPKELNPNGFSARWQGRVHAPKTGIYDFIVKTDHGMKLWINDMREPLMDRWVKSGSDTSFKKSLFLLGGRDYSIQLEFSAYTQGVRNKKNNAKPVEAFIELWWKKPHGALELIPSHYLQPNRGAEFFVGKTTFPPDDSSTGFTRGTSISKAWAEANTSAAIEVSNYILDHLAELSNAKKGSKDFKNKLIQFAEEFAERAFRRPLKSVEKKLYIAAQFNKAPSPKLGLKRSLIMVLSSPRFLYLNQAKENASPYEVASRLSYSLWDSIPDKTLLRAAKENRLSTPEQIKEQALRMLKNPKAKLKMRRFIHHWLEIGIRGELSKSKKLFPEFNDALAYDLEESVVKFVESVIWSKSSNFKELFESKSLYVNKRIAKFYGFPEPKGEGFEKMEITKGHRQGLITQPYILANLAYHDASSPVHRGVFLLRNILGNILHPPPEAFTPVAAELHPKLTTRQRLELQTRPQFCMGCHEKINSLGFALESYDAVGRHRSKDNGSPIDESGSYLLPSGNQQKFEGARSLATFLRGHEEVQTSFITQVFHHLVQQPILAYGKDTPGEFRRQFKNDKYNIQKLLAEIASRSALEGIINFAASPTSSGKGPMAF